MIVDAHSHLGKDFYFGEAKVRDYDKFCIKNNIDIGLLMPMPWPVYSKGKIDVCSLIWEHENYERVNYYKVFMSGNKKVKKPIFINPYEEVNYFYYNILKNSFTKTNLKFIPLVHGVLDNPYYLENMIIKMKPVALKFHGFSGGFFANDVKHDIIEVIKYYDIPLIIHTSVYKYNYGYGYDTKYWRNKCSPKNWFEFLKQHNLKGTLNHGACLDEYVIKMINKSENIMIGIGPDYDISNDPFKVVTDKNIYNKIGYLKLLKKMANPEKLLFDVDYNWNIGNNDDLDIESIYRVKKNWNYVDSENILGKNAQFFYKL